MKVAPQILNSALQGRITAAVSRQGVDLFDLYQGPVNRSSALLAGQNDIEDMHDILFATEPTPANQGAAGNPTAATRRMMVESVRCKITMKNNTVAPIDVTLYDIVPKRDDPRVIDGIKPNFRWQSGVTSEAVTIVGRPANQNAQGIAFPGAKPFQSQEFCQWFTVKKVTHFVLGAGSEHLHYITIKPKYLMNRAGTIGENIFRGLSTYCMAVVRGPIAHDAAPGPTNISYAACVLDYVVETQYKFRSMEKNRTAYQQYSSLPTSLTTPQVVLEETDAVAPVTTA